MESPDTAISPRLVGRRFGSRCHSFSGAGLVAILAGLETSDFAPAVVIPVGLAIISGAAALIVGVLSIITRRERSILVFLSALVGFAYFAMWAVTIVSGLSGSGPGGPIHSPPPPPG